MKHHSLLATTASVALSLLVAVFATPAGATPACPISYGSTDSAKPNKAYLYFPANADATFPEFGVGGLTTSPAAAFNVANLTSYTGSATDLENAITDVVTDDYCEFNVKVFQTTSFPPTTYPRRNIIAIGTDTTPDGGTFGQAQAVDTGDPTLVDYGREWTGTNQSLYGGSGGALNGANSTLLRWARAIGGSAAHEAGHNYGLAHSDDVTPAAGEDAVTRHIMPAGSFIDGEQRAGYRRHFSNATFSILASNIGLSIQTMHNWDFINPNAQVANRLRMTFLSPNPSVILSWSYSGSLSPWVNPTVSGSLGTTVFKGTTYNRFQITWSTPHSWSGSTPGQVGGGAGFHVGATFSGIDFNQPDPIIITGVALLDAGGNPLALQPRLTGYDAGTLDSRDGALRINFFNNGRPLLLENVVVSELPRVLSLNAMVGRGRKLVDWSGEPFNPWPESTRVVLKGSRPVLKGRTLSVIVAHLSDARHIFERVGSTCAIPDNINGKQDVTTCRPGINVDLFPATTLYLTATVVDPKVKHWDRKRKRYITGPLISHVFFQVGGRHPDLNKNGVDDAIDIATEHSRDANHDGVPDEVQGNAAFSLSSFARLLARLTAPVG
jgi:hypothetical protein